MLTLFSIPKVFEGHIGIIQRNAIKSWTLLQPNCEVILLGDDAGTDEVAAELGVRHIPDIDRNELGTPMVDHAFRLAESEANNPFLCYVNADSILMDQMLAAVQRVQEQSNWFLMTARSRGLDVVDPIDFVTGWQDDLLLDLSNRGRLNRHTSIDFWVFPKDLMNGMPSLAVGRPSWESWCLYMTRLREAELIDATDAVITIHQNHDYSHHPGGEQGIGRGIEAQRNREKVGGRPYFFTIRDRTHILTQDGMSRARDGWWIWRSVRAAQVLPHSIPLPMRPLVLALNLAINAGRDVLRMISRRLAG